MKSRLEALPTGAFLEESSSHFRNFRMADNATPKTSTNRPWFLTILGILVILALVLLPFIDVLPKGDEMSDTTRFFGHFHPVVLHLPIGVFILIMLQEIGALISKRRSETPRALGFPLMFGVFSAILAVLAGFLLFSSGADDFAGNELAERHLWGGIFFAVAAVVTLVMKGWSISMAGSPIWYRLLLFGSVGVMTFASHDGASLTHGSDYLTQYAPDPLRIAIGLDPKEVDEPVKDPVVYADVIQPILNRRCVSCHKEEKSKGRLRMDTYEMLVKGGKEGSAIEPGNAIDSNMVYRVELPMDDDEHMPPEGKPQMTPEELQVVKWWIDSGAEPDVKLADAEVPAELLVVITELMGAELEVVKDPKGHGVVAAVKQDGDIIAKVDSLATKYPGSVSFEAQGSGLVALSAVSLRGKLDDEQFAAFKPVIPNLVSADLSATLVTDKSIALLKDAQYLKMLRLGETVVGDEAAKAIAELPAIESVNLFGTKVTDAGVKELAKAKSLKRLYLWQTEVSEEAIAELKEALPELEVVVGVN